MTDETNWKVSLSKEWDVLGPFPIHAREQHFLSPSFPINVSQPMDLNATYPSSYADGGFVGWSKVQSLEDGTLEVSYPETRWEALRATEGWAALQHHSVLRSTITVYPPSSSSDSLAEVIPRLLVNLSQGSFFAIAPISSGDGDDSTVVPEWHAGNIYALERSPPNAVALPTKPSSTFPTTYNILVSGDYEIRLFGDPRHGGSGVPKLSISLTVDIEVPTPSVVLTPSHDILCDFVEGWAFGDALGVGLTSRDGWWTVQNISAASEFQELDILQETRIAPTQTRIVPIKLTQSLPVTAEALKFTLTIVSDETTSRLDVALQVKHRAHWGEVVESSAGAGIKGSYFWGGSTPTAFLATAPYRPNVGQPRPPILALHGAGVDIFASDLWVQAVPRQEHSWSVLPAGRTAWGMDWHGPSANEAWSAVDALSQILDERVQWQEWAVSPKTKVLLMGHSNGGQGAWYIASRFPDRVVGVVPAAGYIKSQAYVPWVQSRSAHYVDPALRAILDSSLTPDDNDLFISNLVDTPVLAIHGGDDDNVPVWHTREAVSVLRSWNPNANVTFREDPGQPHWYPTVFANEQVQAFVSSTLESTSTADNASASRSFTLTVAVPSDSGSLHGWSILSLTAPGRRLGRLTVESQKGAWKVHTRNVRAFSIHIGSLPLDARHNPLEIDGRKLVLADEVWNTNHATLTLEKNVDGQWTPYPEDIARPSPLTGRLANVLNSARPITIVIPTKNPSRELSVALRLAHNLNVYLKVDADIIDDEEAKRNMGNSSFGSGNMIVLGLSNFARTVLNERKTAFGVVDGALSLKGRLLNQPNMAALFLHPHPTHAESLALFIHGTDSSGLERALRVFPIRTGVTVPDWIFLGSQADSVGTGGVEGAGVWGNDWGWNEAMSAF
ncbi:hypothetical protein PYCCODRAFT_1495213 [Trametes coccinea BRFM310]|uniref:Peptidase S9 prolyl oligopeptidase catalytic domain-containing protein n=1 Tax=Trametes coccinea (strain BRFM310) TaxID=1353009 RepID=A0A1Y2IRD2_TRAC3|nr:hypothetical protein PYCCODRAFT_1495213 [Trametes coccinea BRFM310]